MTEPVYLQQSLHTEQDVFPCSLTMMVDSFKGHTDKAGKIPPRNSPNTSASERAATKGEQN